MDETRFRDLLARHWTTLFDPHTIEKGADYLRRGYVLGTHYEEGDGEGALIGMVEGTARNSSAFKYSCCPCSNSSLMGNRLASVSQSLTSSAVW